MNVIRNPLLGLILLLGAGQAGAADLNCHGAPNVEELRYAWHLRGGLGWVAGFVFPSSGVGDLKTTYPKAGQHQVESELLITAKEGVSGGFYAYQSQMDDAGLRTATTYHGYAWGKKSRKERTVFDYGAKVARSHKETPDKVEDKVRPIPPESLADGSLRDILTAIYFLRQNATSIKGAITTSVYSDGKDYAVVFRPIGRSTFTVGNQRYSAIGFEITDAPGGKKFPGGIRVWVGEDSRRIPFRIEIQQSSLASLQLDLQSIEACTFMQGR